VYDGTRQSTPPTGLRPGTSRATCAKCDLEPLVEDLAAQLRTALRADMRVTVPSQIMGRGRSSQLISWPDGPTVEDVRGAVEDSLAGHGAVAVDASAVALHADNDCVVLARVPSHRAVALAILREASGGAVRLDAASRRRISSRLRAPYPEMPGTTEEQERLAMLERVIAGLDEQPGLDYWARAATAVNTKRYRDFVRILLEDKALDEAVRSR
jgi:hypothetical protein